MPNIKSSKKRIKINIRNYERNKAYKSALKTAIKKANAAIENNTEDKMDLIKAAIIKLDKAVTKGILHKNTAARKKSQLVRKSLKQA